MGPHCTVRRRALTVAFAVAWTLEPDKSLCTISTVQLVFLCDGLARSPSEAVPLDLLWKGPGVLLADWQSVALWEEDVWNSLCLFMGTQCEGVSSSDFVGVLNHLLRASNHALLAVCGWLLWTAAGDTIGLFQSSSCSSGRGIAHTGRVWCWSPLNLYVALGLVCC